MKAPCLSRLQIYLSEMTGSREVTGLTAEVHVPAIYHRPIFIG